MAKPDQRIQSEYNHLREQNQTIQAITSKLFEMFNPNEVVEFMTKLARSRGRSQSNSHSSRRRGR